MPRSLALLVSAAAIAACGGSEPASPSLDAGGADAPDAGDAWAPPAPCRLAPAGDPIALVSFEDRHATAPSMVVLDPGAADRPASVALEVFANAGWSGKQDDIEIARARAGAAWPAEVKLDREPQLLGQFSLGWGALAVGGDGALALAWHMDTVAKGEQETRTMDVASWTARDPVAIADHGGAILSFVSGAGVAGASWGGEGYAVAWRDLAAPNLGPVYPSVAILDAKGAVVAGPAHVGGGEDYPGRAPAIVWTGHDYLVATAFKDCPGLDAICVARSVLFGKLSLAGGLHEDRIAAIGVLDPATVPGTAAAAAIGDRVYVAWAEGDAKDTAAPRTIRLATLDVSGKPASEATTLAKGAHPITNLGLSAGDAGVLVTWAESGSPITPITEPGASYVVVQRVGYDGSIDAPLRIAATQVDDYVPPRTAAIASPRAALVLWSGRRTTDGALDVTWMTRLDCAP